MPPIIRSILAIAAGFLFIGALASGTGAALQSAGIYPAAGEPLTDVGLILLETAYVAVFAIAGCWLAAWLAPKRPMRHALILGFLGLAFNVLGAVMTWGQRPVWAMLLNLALVMPYALIGGRLRERQVHRAGMRLAGA
jgi:MFS-type transporter involved in bile tolerance (Atg22 family)